MAWLKVVLEWLFRKPVEVAPEAPKQPIVVPITIPVETPPMIIPPTVKSNREHLYDVAASCLGTHQTLNPSVPQELGCAEAWSSVAKKAGVEAIPKTGIAGTSNLFAWLVSNPAFVEVKNPLPGDTIISPTGHGNGTVTGHVGFIAKNGIMSNNSNNGLFQEHWNLMRWQAHYGVAGALPVKFFRWK